MTTKPQAKKTAPQAAPVSSGFWAELGTLRERTNDKGDTSTYIVLNKNVQILVDGEEVDLGEYRTVKLIDPRKGLETARDNGKIDDETYEERLNALDERNVVFKLTVPPVNK